MRRILLAAVLFASLAVASPAAAAAAPTNLTCSVQGNHVTNFNQITSNGSLVCTGQNRGAAGVHNGGFGMNGNMTGLVGPATCFESQSLGPSAFGTSLGWNGAVSWTWVGETMEIRGMANDGAGRTVDVTATLQMLPTDPLILLQCVGGTPPSMNVFYTGTMTIVDHASNT